MSTLSQLIRFCNKVEIDRDGPLTNDKPCWLWNGAIFQDTGYAAVHRDNRTQTGHRWIWLAFGGIPIEGLVLDHLCRVRHCVNPIHLEQVTQKTNINRGEASPVTEDCRVCGSRMAGDNLCVISTTGMRQCRSCRIRRSREYRARLIARFGTSHKVRASGIA